MGSRTEWIIKTNTSDSALHLYSHYGGESKFEDTQQALFKAQPRWNDISYGARIFTSQIIGNDWDSETGFGIAIGNDTDNMFEESYFHAVIDFPNQLVTFGSMTWTFDEFVVADNFQEILVEEYWAEVSV
jgi:archaellin